MSVLEVETLHMYPLENAQRHHTDLYELVHRNKPTPVLRRGQSFFIVFKFKDRSYNDKVDVVRLIFNYGTRPVTKFGLPVSEIGVAVLNSNEVNEDIHDWNVHIKGRDPDAITLEVRSPVTAPVGVWRLTVETSVITFNNAAKQIYEYPEFIYILFNPWLKEDLVYMPKEQLLDEYVLNDVGKIWVGPMGTTRGREWVFGQFDAIVLPAVMLLLERTGLQASAKGDPIMLTRAISKLVNSNDDDLGVLQGKWDGEYEGGTAPAAWTGSVPILEKYLETRKEVLYGQCWVFAGVVTTVCRALGIPSRVVSNLVSAHDANESLTIDRYYSSKNDPLPFDPNNPLGEDSIWNYHVWNDVWMARPDLPTGYGGWQAIDATPQEESKGFYQCGPASVEAVKHGEVGLNYDTRFLLASVNADLVRWKEDPDSPVGFRKIECNRYHIGRMIITKQPYIFDPNGDGDRQIITEEYKPSEGTPVERLSLYNGIRGTTRAKRFYELPDAAESDVTFELVDITKINIGDNFSIIVKLNNTSNEVRNIQVALSTGSVFYTGVKAHQIKKASDSFKMQPNSKEQLKLNVTAEEYLDKLVEYCLLKMYVIATVHETKQTWAGEDDFQVIVPNILIT
ncbi:hemocyte protein-glutamine gamma-glutamyltransferase-like isoform X2 [Lycorma delicatula]